MSPPITATSRARLARRPRLVCPAPRSGRRKGADGQTGPQGPGAKAFSAAPIGNQALTTLVQAGAWTISDSCSSSNGATIKFTGPGNVAYTDSIGTIAAPRPPTSSNGPIGAGGSFTAGTNGQFEATLLLTSGGRWST